MRKKILLFALCLLAVMIPVALGAMIILSNHLITGVNVIEKPVTITWVTNPAGTQQLKGVTYYYNLSVTTSNYALNNGVVNFCVIVGRSIMFTSANDVQVQYQTTAGGAWNTATPSVPADFIDEIVFQIPLPTIPASSTWIQPISVTFAATAPTNSYTYDLVVQGPQ